MEQDAGNRIGFLDELRGLAILLMAAYHAAFDLAQIWGVQIPFLFSPWMNGLRDCFAGVFVWVCGACCRFSQKGARRGLTLLGFGCILTAATWLFAPGMTILFGILHCLGVCILLFSLLRPALDKIPDWPGIPGAFLLFLALFPLPRGRLLFWRVPAFPPSFLLFALGLPVEEFVSGDYFPLVPWVFLFLSGSWGGRLLCRRECSFLRPVRVPFLALAGRHTLWIYLLHQPVLLVCFSVFFQFCS